MKKFLLIMFLVILCVVEFNAADYKFMGGITFSRCKEAFGLNIDIGVDFDSYGIGFLIGGGVEFILSKNLSIELDGLYFQKSSIFKELIWSSEEFRYFSSVLHEITFPVLFKFDRVFASSYLFGGGEIAFVISPELDLLSRLDYGAVFGVGIEVKEIIPYSHIEIRCHIGQKANTIALVLGF